MSEVPLYMGRVPRIQAHRAHRSETSFLSFSISHALTITFSLSLSPTHFLSLSPSLSLSLALFLSENPVVARGLPKCSSLPDVFARKHVATSLREGKEGTLVRRPRTLIFRSFTGVPRP